MITKPCVISTDTLLTEHLIPSWMAALERLEGGVTRASQLREIYPEVFSWFDNRKSEWDRMEGELLELGNLLMQDLAEALDTHAPTGTYFGPSDGDGACFGFWAATED